MGAALLLGVGIFTGLASGLPALAAAAEYKEPATGITFASELKGGLPFLGAGVRYKWGLVKVYAVGLYAAGAGACGSGDALWQGLVDSKERKAVVIKMARTIDAQKLVDALEEAFKPRLALPGRSDKNMAAFRQVPTKGAGSTRGPFPVAKSKRAAATRS